MKAKAASFSTCSAFSIKHSASISARLAFSLFEVLVVMAFLAIIGGIVTLNFDKLLPAVEHKPLDRVFIQTLQDARILAATSGNEVMLSFDPQAEAFVLKERLRSAPVTNEEEDEDAFDAPQPGVYGFDKADETEVLFYKRLAQKSGFGSSRDEYSTESVKYLLFHPSGVSTPARVVIRQPGLDDIEVELDAFSSGPIEEKDKF